MTGQTHVAGGALFTAAGLGAAIAAGWMHAPAWALAIGIAWGAIAGDLPRHRPPQGARVPKRGGVRSRRPVTRPSHPHRRLVHPRPARRATAVRPAHSLALMALWTTIAPPLYLASAGGLLVVLAWMIDNVAAVSHTGAHLTPQPAIRYLLAHLPVIYPYAAVCTALGYLSHLVLDSLTGPIPWGWPFAHRRISLAPAPLRIRTRSSLETWVVRPALTVAATLAFLEVGRDPARAPSPRADCGDAPSATPVRRDVCVGISTDPSWLRESGTTLCPGGS